MSDLDNNESYPSTPDSDSPPDISIDEIIQELVRRCRKHESELRNKDEEIRDLRVKLEIAKYQLKALQALIAEGTIACASERWADMVEKHEAKLSRGIVSASERWAG
jgi:phage shock protein A